MRSLISFPTFSALSFLIALIAPTSGHAFHYLEHSYFTDKACGTAQRVLGERLFTEPDNHELAARYMALAVVCPNTWIPPYCNGGYKQAEANINRLPTGRENRGVPITLGDFSALPDHISNYGPVAGLPGAAKQRVGLIEHVFQWIARKPGDAGGIIGDVAEDACETDPPVDWERIENRLNEYLDKAVAGKGPYPIPRDALSTLSRAPVRQGPQDPSGPYSFDNPHFLDLVLRDNHHFGDHAYGAWLGFHSTAIEVAERSCEANLAFEPSTLRSMARGLPTFEEIPWKKLDDEALAFAGCALLRERVRLRLLEWRDRSPVGRWSPVRQRLAKFADGKAAAAELDAIVSALMALGLEGSGLHFLQDGLASGHMRAVYSRRSLGDRRFDHDYDSREGVVAMLETSAGRFPTVAFGDTYLLGPALDAPVDCDWSGILSASQVSDCLLDNQRGFLVSAVAASLVDWALGGKLDELPKVTGDGETELLPAERFVYAYLPVNTTRVVGQDHVEPSQRFRQAGSIPVPPPPYAYESLAFKVANDLSGRGNQIGLDVAFYEELGQWATWLTSYRVGLRSTSGRIVGEQFTADFSYGFHWRWAARFLVDLEPFFYTGVEGQRPSRLFIMGIGPQAGITLLPEGWIKLPLELSVSYRFPLTMFSSQYGFFGKAIRIEGHYLQFSLGMAFM